MKNYLTATISASALRHNLTQLRVRLAPGVQLTPVVKDDCYGHGLKLIYPIMSELVDGFVVASPSEALELRAYGYEGFILCLLSAYFDEWQIQEQLVRERVTQTVMSKSALERITAAATRCGKQAEVHIKVDSGMGRLGVAADQAARLFALVDQSPSLKLTGAYSHFATADDAESSFREAQLATFLQALPNDQNLVRHIANSAALIDASETHLDMVRPGLAVYGCHYAEHLRSEIDLRPCMAVEAELIAIKTMPKGSTSGYGRTHTYARESRVAVVPIGYGDGYFRSLSNQAVVRLHGKAAPVCGRVSMDQMSVDITDIPEAQVGDRVEVIAADASAPNSVENLAKLAGTIPYEITCHMGRKLRHLLVK